MNRIFKKVLPIIMSIVLFGAFATTAMAADIAPRNTLISSTSCSISDNNNDTARVSVSAKGIASVSQIDVDIEVQVKGLFGYSTDQTLSKTFYSSSGNYLNTISINSSKTYRLYVTYTATSSSGSETVYKTSSTT